MNEFLLPALLLGGWAIFSIGYLIKAYNSPASINPYILDSIPSVFPTIGIMCTAGGIAYGLSDFNANDIQGSLPILLGGLKTAFYATIAGIAGLIVFQKAQAIVQHRIDTAPDRPRSSSDELTALDGISERLLALETSLQTDLGKVHSTLIDSNKDNNEQINALRQLVAAQNEKAQAYHNENVVNIKFLLSDLSDFTNAQESHSKGLNNGIANIIEGMRTSNDLLVDKFDEFAELLRKNNTEALVEVMRASTEQFNAQMSELIDKLVKENFKELNGSVQMLNTWQKENKDQVSKLSEQVKIILEQVDIATSNLKVASNVLTTVADVNQELVSDDGKLMTLVTELEKVMISDGKFTAIVDKVDGTIDTLTTTTDAFYETTKKLNGSVSTLNTWQQENKAQVAELSEQVRTILTQVHIITTDLQTTTSALTITAKLNHQLVDDDSKLMKMINELDKVMVSDGKFTEITSKVEGAVNTLSKTTDAFDGTTQKLNVWVRNQMNFNEKAEILVKQLEEFRNLNGTVWDKYRAEMSKAVSIVSTTSTSLKNDLENINQEFYDRLNDTLQNLDGLIQRFMSGQPTNRR